MADFELDTEYTFDCRFEVNAVACDWGDIEGDINDQTDLKDALDNKADVETVNGIDERLGTVENTIEGYGNIVTHDVSEFASAEQGALADTSLQPNDNISELVNDAGYITSSSLPTVNNSTITIQKNGTKIEDFTLNQSTDKSINITVPTQLSELGTENQMSAINSGMNSTLAGQITTNQNAISLINGKIPEQASSLNQLADKNFVNSSISTNTANFIGTFNSVAELEAYSGTLTNNDYAFVIGTDGDGNTVYNRYKYTTATTPASWIFEYALNNSSFTANQWASINSSANTTNIGQIAINTNAITLINTTIGGYGDIVTHNVSEFATAQQGSLADTSLQPNDNISELVNDAGYTSNVGTVISVNNTSPDANGNVSISIPPTQVQADWDEADPTSKAYIQNKPYIPSGVVIDQVFDGTSENGQSGKAILPVLHSSKGYTESGQVYSDTQLYNDILTQYTNSFDLSKFTVVGTPTITDDGIASGFSSSNYITALTPTPAINYTQDSHLLIQGIFSLNEVATSVLFHSECGFNGSCYINSSGALIFQVNSSPLTYLFVNFGAVAQHIYSFEIELKNKILTGFIKDLTTNETYTDSKSLTTETFSYPVPKNIGAGGIGAGNYLHGSIYLKAFSITVDGVEVFSGHKTGTDLIITDNYTVVGSPTITDGVASGFGENNYVTTGTFLNNLGDYDTWEIEIPSITATATSGTYFGTLIHSTVDGTQSTQSIHIDMNNSHILRVYLKAIDGTNIFYNSGTPDTFALNSQLDVKIKFTGTQYLIQTRISGEDWKTQLTTNNSKKLYKTNLPILFGSANTTGNTNWYNSINLYGIRFIGNNKLIYAGKCQIPYNISDNGNKIVDVQYRPDVAYANTLGYKSSYFTIDTTNQNVTLPYKDLYALITQSFNYNYSHIQGYNATATQTLKHISGVLQWETD